jgi:2-C-methyl-D-erythritol 4-phosphate cytidylyltransferase/2-C-methyl-D-erythritol 2,4-cyclodiphosphate synthase
MPGSIALLIVAAGRATRAAAALPKQYALLAGQSVLSRCVEAFATQSAIARIQVVIHPDDRALYDAAVREWSTRLEPPALGGATRQESVRAGLRALKTNPPGIVLIHDAARPFVAADLIDRVIAALGSNSGAIAALPVADTLKQVGEAGIIRGTVERAGLWRAQTPQGFEFTAILDAHEAAFAAGRTDFTDDAAVAEWAGIDVVLVTGSERNVKLTTKGDLETAERMIAGGALAHPAEVRTGVGFDVHRTKAGDHVWLCGVRIPHSAGLDGHSDADVALHALTDAILGAIGDGDIGEHFPPADSRWQGAPSRLFLADAARRVADRGGRVANVDLTLMCEAPRIAPHREAMRAAIASILRIGHDQVGVKATTTEGLGFTGRGEGIAAIATATVELPRRHLGPSPTGA